MIKKGEIWHIVLQVWGAITIAPQDDWNRALERAVAELRQMGVIAVVRAQTSSFWGTQGGGNIWVEILGLSEGVELEPEELAQVFVRWVDSEVGLLGGPSISTSVQLLEPVPTAPITPPSSSLLNWAMVALLLSLFLALLVRLLR